ncbi:hypothetical protein GobsT_17960 [Gemmata obscuriglobus]|uniref:DUF6900 domain-containing protein n=1 Tax=Gemmata obscuriglobus TaxID=114 RepID=A0A2Z3HDQ8_9BACT|nr:hypothetical protein [Gemmata obscuriglobus]AWM39834.1 hypothetical protein C1280_24385 [Gemmata obscuriglobus]QEG27043.1 hypothetical protein GobsT_17960 [Gemmata obscuriglobus]VTS03422.1 unnamed protein product [Gemmata obscuriglobus UQM 2246]
MAECYFCGVRADTAPAWVTEFYRAGGECVREPTCPTCAAVLLTKDENGAFVLAGADPVKEAVRRVAEQAFKWPLEARKSDRLDFHEVACWEIERALTAAYRAGRAAR